MSELVAVGVFVLSLAISVTSSIVLAKRIAQLGSWLRLSEGLLGLLTALAADAPEVAAAVTAIVGGHHDVGLGVVFGSNIFNLTALLGVSAITAGCGRVRIAAIWFDGGVGSSSPSWSRCGCSGGSAAPPRWCSSARWSRPT